MCFGGILHPNELPLLPLFLSPSPSVSILYSIAVVIFLGFPGSREVSVGPNVVAANTAISDRFWLDFKWLFVSDYF